MPYTAEQLKVIRAIQRIGRRRGEERVKIKAALETGAVESNFQNLNYGDADSKGWRQERGSLYKNPTNLKASINRFYNEADQLYKGQHAGQLAADVQRPAAQYRNRYGHRAGEAKALLHGVQAPAGGGSSPTRSVGQQPTGVDPAARQQLLLSYLADRNNPDALLTLAQGLRSLPQQQAKATGNYSQPQTSRGGGSVKAATFDGKPVRADFAKELAWARQNGWKGTVTSGFRTKAQQMAAAKSYGLQHYGPNGPLGSNHVVGHKGAVDVTNPEQLNKILGRYPGKRTLVWGGPVIGDKVHFSPNGH